MNAHNPHQSEADMSEYQYNKQDRQIRIRVEGDLKFDNHSAFRTLLREFDENDATTLVVDLSQVSEIDSAGLGILLLFKEAADRNNASLVVQGAQGQVAYLLDISNLSALISIR